MKASSFCTPLYDSRGTHHSTGERTGPKARAKNVKLQAEDAQLYLQVDQVSWQARLLPRGGLPSEAVLEQKANKSKRPHPTCR